MTSAKQVAANRRNAQKSTGPRTVEGKAIASHNATTHGLLSDELLIRGEESENLQILEQALRIEHQPVGAVEDQLVDQITMCLWRLRRIRAVETSIFEMAISSDSVDTRYSRYPNYRGYLAKKMREESAQGTSEIVQAKKRKSGGHGKNLEGRSSSKNSKELIRESSEGSHPAPGEHAERLGRVFKRTAGTLANLQRYRVATERSLDRALRELARLQGARGGGSALVPTTLNLKATKGTSQG